MKRKICIVTGTRAEYGLLYSLLKGIKNEKTFKLQILVTGMHLSPEFGLTYKQIEKDGFKIDEKVEMLLSSDSEAGIVKSMGLGMIGFADAYNRMKPDMIILLGDRFETLSAAVAAVVNKIPIVHLHGGEVTEGAFDDYFRHAITKMSTYHFTSTAIYRNRIIQMGENPRRVYNVGAIGIDNIRKMKLYSKKEIINRYGIQFNKRNILFTYHPVTLEKNTSYRHIKEILKALDAFNDMFIIFTMSNADTHGRIINKMITQYSEKNPDRTKVFTSLGSIGYLSCLQYVDVVVGNSSSGIIEVPSFGIPTVDIGDRQKGRLKPDSVINCLVEEKSIIKAIKKAFSQRFKDKCKQIKNPYGDGHTCLRIIKQLKKVDFNPEMLKKGFYDLLLK